MHDSVRSASVTKSAYYFDDASSVYTPSPNGKAVLINCSGGGLDTHSINCDTSFKLSKITLDNFNGNNIPTDITFNILN